MATDRIDWIFDTDSRASLEERYAAGSGAGTIGLFEQIVITRCARS